MEKKQKRKIKIEKEKTTSAQCRNSDDDMG